MSETLPARSTNAGRIVLDTFRSPRDPMLQSWLRFRAHVAPDLSDAGVATLVPSDGSALRSGHFGVWRILATNNREIARGAALHGSPTDALADVERLQEIGDSLTMSVARGPSPITHGWTLRCDDEIVLICSRWYESGVEAAAAARTARLVLGRATIVRSVNIGTRSGRRQRHEVLPPETGG